MEPLMEDEEFSIREVVLPSLIPVVPEPELEREDGERRRGRDVIIAVDHGPNSKHAFDWALVHFCRLADTIHLVHAVSSVKNDVVYETSQALMEKLAVEAFQVAMVKSVARVVEGEAGKVICKEAERLKPAAVIMGTRGRSLVRSVLQGSVSEYCFHNCKSAPVIIVPGKVSSSCIKKNICYAFDRTLGVCKSPSMAEFAELESQDGVRMPWNIIPVATTKDHQPIDSEIPVSAIYTPLAPSTPLLPYAPLRCRTCRSVLNPYSVVDFSASTWGCPFCFNRNPFPSNYSSISDTNLPPELFPRSTTVEYLSSSSSSPPPVFLFVVDTCLFSDELDFLRSSLSQALDLIPDASVVGLIAFDSLVRVYELGFPHCTKSYFFHGNRDCSKDQLLDQLSFFVKSPKPSSGVIAGVRDGLSAEDIARFLPPASDCQFTLHSVLEELGSSQWPAAPDHRPGRCTGVALRIAACLLGACFPGSAARIMAFVGGPSTLGPGAIVSPELSEPIRSHKDIGKDSAPCYHEAVEFYEKLAKQLVHQGHVLDVFASSVDQVGIAEMRVAVEQTGGFVVLAESFGHSVFRDSLKRVFQSGENDLGLSSCGIFEINCSKGVKVQGIIGPCASLEKKGPLCSDTGIGQGHTSAWKMCGLVADQSVLLPVFNIVRDLKLFHLKLQVMDGEELTNGFDQEAAAVVMARLISFKMETQPEFNPQRWADKALVNLCSQFGEYQKGNASSFNLPSQLSNFPQFVFHLRRSQFVQVFNNSPDETAYFRMILNRENVSNSVVMIQPWLVSFTFNSQPEPIPLDVASIAADRILLLDAYFTLVIFHGATIAQWRKAGYHHQPEHQALVHLLQSPRDYSDTIINERFPIPRLVICDQYGSQARFLLAKLNPSSDGNGPFSGGSNVFTDDVSMSVFLDHLRRLIVH
ncbi:hypothetical protein DY000_02057265 [Brassica cretica]|uniref:Protein transport protein SEC23 n=1 Tax=Brassica cretica TaxID=69181 RepID=A0ABQ7AK67_BRACR|nr:hypothetical protein DY000_02057265 [Brassica cretica]